MLVDGFPNTENEITALSRSKLIPGKLISPAYSRMVFHSRDPSGLNDLRTD